MEKQEKLMIPSEIIVQAAGLLKDKGHVLDLAAGGGRNGRYMLEQGHKVTFLDKNVDGLDDLAKSTDAIVIKADLEDGSPWALGDEQFNMVIVSNYLWRPIMQQIFGSVKSCGIMVYETFAQGNEVYGKPSNPDFLLTEGELKTFVKADFEILDYQHGYVETPKPAIKQSLIAQRH